MVTPLPRPVFPARMAAHGSMGARRERDRDARGVRDAGFLRGTRRQPERRVRGYSARRWPGGRRPAW